MEECNLWQDVRQQLIDSCTHFDGSWVKRHRIFDTQTTVKGLLHLVGSKDQSYASVMDQIELGGDLFPAASSFCEARAKMPAFVLGELRQDVLEASDEHLPGRLWHGYRVHAVDGTKVTLPLPLLREGFTNFSSGHYPQGLVSMLVRLDDRAVCDIRLSKKGDERGEAHEHLAFLKQGDLAIYDRGYLSFALLGAHIHQGVAGVFRVAKTTSFKAIDKFWKSRKNEAIVTIEPSLKAYSNARKRDPDYELGPLQVRLIKYKIGDETYVLATTILDFTIPAAEFIDLYSCRWWSEEVFKTYKQTLELETFHAKSVNGVCQELEAMTLLWNLTRIISSMAEPEIKKTSLLSKIIALSSQF